MLNAKNNIKILSVILLAELTCFATFSVLTYINRKSNQTIEPTTYETSYYQEEEQSEPTLTSTTINTTIKPETKGVITNKPITYPTETTYTTPITKSAQTSAQQPLNQDLIIDCMVGDQMYHLKYSDCKKKLDDYWNAKDQERIQTYSYPTINQTVNTSTSNNTINTSNCNNQYQMDLIQANQFSGSAAEAVRYMAKTNYDKCLQTGQTSQINIQTQQEPVDNNGNPCSIYAGEELAKAHGCP